MYLFKGEIRKKMIEIIDKRNNTIKEVSEDYKIEYAGEKYAIKDLHIDNLKVFCIILKEEETDLLYKKED